MIYDNLFLSIHVDSQVIKFLIIFVDRYKFSYYLVRIENFYPHYSRG